MPGARFCPHHHLRRGADFRRIYDERRSVADANLIVYGSANQLPYSRIGLSVSRKVGGAVERNRWKRLLREAFRLVQHDLPAGLDLVVIPRPGVEPALSTLMRSLTSLAKRVATKVLSNRK